MAERLSAEEMALWAAESASAPRHNATMQVFAATPGFDYGRLLDLVADRIAFVPRYRQRLRPVPARVANPVWVDDEDFDLAFHVRRSALPRPGSMAQLRELVARIMSRRLDRSRPLWEMYLVEGLADGRLAVLTKSHQVLVDGVSTVDLGQLLLDAGAVPMVTEPDGWLPDEEPRPPALFAEAVTENLLDPRAAAAIAWENAGTVLRLGASIGQKAVEVANLLGERRSAPESPFDVELSEQRRFVTVRTELAAYRKVRSALGGTVNDVVLATVTGALRTWLMTRAEPMPGSRQVRALVPLSVIGDDDLEPTSVGGAVTGHPLGLPVGESSPVVRLHQVSYALKAHKDTGRAVAADRLADVAGFAPTTFHALASRVAARHSRRSFNVVVTNVPGPQFPLYAAGARMLENYPVQPLLPGHALAIGVTSYDGGVYFGMNADFDALADVDVLGQCVQEALEELVEAATQRRRRAPRGRRTEGVSQPGARRAGAPKATWD